MQASLIKSDYFIKLPNIFKEYRMNQIFNIIIKGHLKSEK